VHGTMDLTVVRHLCHFMYDSFELLTFHVASFNICFYSLRNNPQRQGTCYIYSLPLFRSTAVDTVDTSTADLTVVRHLVIDPYSSWLDPEMVEILICIKDCVAAARKYVVYTTLIPVILH
jgi:hypothetical protein